MMFIGKRNEKSKRVSDRSMHTSKQNGSESRNYERQVDDVQSITE